jgi:hypothetical protein
MVVNHYSTRLAMTSGRNQFPFLLSEWDSRDIATATVYPVKRNNPPTTGVNGLHQVEPTGIEPATSWLQTREPSVVSGTSKGLTTTPSAACTSACTSNPENDNADTPDAGQSDPLAKLAAALLTLSPADRERLAEMLRGGREESTTHSDCSPGGP